MVVVSEQERRLVRELLPGIDATVVPNGVDTRACQPLDPEPSREMLFVGNLAYGPNVDGILRFCDEVDGAAPHQVADIFVCKIGKVYSHAGIIGPYPTAIHASVADQIVTLCDLEREAWPDAPRRFFRLKAWCDGR